jgi:hypothetical protein
MRVTSPVFGCLAVVGMLALFTARLSPAMAQVPLRAVQTSDGTLYVAQDTRAWKVVPSDLNTADLAGLAPSGELDGAVPAPFLDSANESGPPLQVMLSGDGTLYVVQAGDAWLLVPDQIGDADLAALTIVRELTGPISATDLGQSQGLPTALPAATSVPTPAPAPTNPPPPTPTPGLTSAPEPIIVTKEVPGTSGPWLYVKGGLNSAYPYTENEPKGLPTSPTVFNASDGLTFKSGAVLHVKYASGGTGQGAGYTLNDGNGNQKERPPVCPDPRPFPYGHCPSVYVSGAHNVMELVGVFTDQSGAIVGKPVVVGNSADLTIPDGASALSLGVNDSGYFNNIGSLQVTVR